MHLPTAEPNEIEQFEVPELRSDEQVTKTLPVEPEAMPANPDTV